MTGASFNPHYEIKRKQDSGQSADYYVTQLLVDIQSDLET